MKEQTREKKKMEMIFLFNWADNFFVLNKYLTLEK